MNKSVRKFVFLNILAFLFYYCSGRLSLNLSSLDGYSTPIWPPAGIALALILIFGKKVWFGLFIGAFFCNTNSVTFENGFYKFIIFNFHNLIVAFGNSIQALIAACFLKRFAKFPNSLCSQNEKECLMNFLFFCEIL